MHLRRKCKWNTNIACIADIANIADTAGNCSSLDRFAFAHTYDFDSARRKAIPHGTPMLALTAMLAMSALQGSRRDPVRALTFLQWKLFI